MRSLTIGIGLVVLAGFLFMKGCSSYNTFVDKEENVENAWSKVQSAYQRRSDLIENLVATVKGAAQFEQKTLTDIANARANATSVKIDPSNLTPEKMEQFQQAQSQLSQSLGRLLMVTENYPELKANQNFLELQSQLEGTENRVKVERDKFNDVVTDFNKSVRRFPNSLFAGMFGFSQKAQFEAEQSAQSAPKVNFE
ncbi:MAG TPA: LemA family protein [Saprospiraceae bacterium]|nr:LemA family protein [Saprospiraceae bacterium]HRJ15502.1 LemA family protein [Saprospiraceae bacterium]HRK80003.1 LemA family protein [Saprospiraceae bacterium]